MMLPNLKDLSERISALFLPAKSPEKTLPIWIAGNGGELPEEVSGAQRAWLEATDFQPKPGKWALLPGDNGFAGAVVGIDGKRDLSETPLFTGSLPSHLPQGDYHFGWQGADPFLDAVSWALGQYEFLHYRTNGNGSSGRRRLRLPDGVELEQVINTAAANWLGRDLINTPANDLGPEELEEAACGLADQFGAAFETVAGDDLLAKNFPLIHSVGRASTRPPRLIDLRWGDADAPKVTLVGKGVCFDTGGLNIKPGSAMALMKKDMGGSAAALTLAAMIMGAGLPVRLRLLISAAENSISGNAFRPGDVLKSRKGLHVEIGDTDAEGRLVLADALALADEETPEHLFSFATLTGSARVALGPDLPPVYSTDDAVPGEIAAIGRRIGDPSWPMPLWQPYDQLLDSRIGDINSVIAEPFAGSIMAALFLKRFVANAKRYTHFDIYGWTPRAQPGKPFGGEPQCARAVFDYLKGQFAGS